jgi:hypothetical protein
MSENDDFATQAMDMIFQNDAVKAKLKQKTYPYILTGVAFNLLLLVLLCFLVFSVYNVKLSLLDIRRRLD